MEMSETLNRITRVNDELIRNLTFQRDTLEKQNRELIWHFKRIRDEGAISQDVNDFARYCMTIAESAIKTGEA